ncbi:signal peptidase II [Marinicauda salina]|jgi:signal peptidase II|uniref:Lipoprotein signal peptidase n=1 Tax=Marinicauda salina TaxID=2135793 RepID=A0A2U2BSF7_9PROT|nr:signal peptidase II [Marinicauda salina]PWE16939.1 signal peptidase II [Marinicauda salina]
MSGERSSAVFAVTGFVLAATVFVLDQVSKFWILRVLDLDGMRGGRVYVLDPWFNLTMVWNRGVSFGLFAADSDWQRVILVALSLTIAGLLAAWLLRAERWLQTLAFGLIIGGALGNVVDRVIHGAVADFLDFSGLYFPYVFNVADAAITTGVAALLLDLLIGGEDART